MTFFFFKAPSHFINLVICKFLCILFLLSNISAVLILARTAARELSDLVPWNIVKASMYAFAMSIPVMPFVFGVHGFNVSTLNLFALVYLVAQVTFIAIQYNINWRKIIIPLSFAALIAWVVMALANYWLYGHIASWLWPFFRAI